MCNSLVFSSLMLGFNVLVVCFWLKAPEISSGGVQSVVQPTTNDGGKRERGPRTKRIRLSEGQILTLEAGALLPKGSIFIVFYVYAASKV